MNYSLSVPISEKRITESNTATAYLAASASECVVFSTVAESYIYVRQYEDPHFAIDEPLSAFRLVSLPLCLSSGPKLKGVVHDWTCELEVD